MAAAETRLLTIDQVLDVIGNVLSVSTIGRYSRTGLFPPYRQTNARGDRRWYQHEVEEWKRAYDSFGLDRKRLRELVRKIVARRRNGNGSAASAK